MKTIDEKFNENFDKINIDLKRHRIKQFYQKEIQAMVDEMIGERNEPYILGFSNGYDKKRLEIINIAKKYGFNK